MLAAGPHAERPRYDPHAAEKAQARRRAASEKVGKDAAMPWETDGRRWHTEQRVTHKGQPCRWEGEILDWVDEHIHELGKFADTNWKQPTIVEIAGPVKSQGWFFHAHTGMEWLVRLVFRVAKNTFKQDELDRAFGIPVLDETEGRRSLRPRAARPRRQSQGAVAGSLDAGPSPERNRHAGVSRVS